MKIKDFIKVFGESGHSARFEGCIAKNGDISNGQYKVEASVIYYTYIDKNGMIYDSAEVPVLHLTI